MNDTNSLRIEKIFEGKQINAREIILNGKKTGLVKLGDIAEVRDGLTTGDNDFYLFQNPEARGNYKNIDNYSEFLILENELEKINEDSHLRHEIINNGISLSSNSDRYFGGRYIIPYDKGGESESDEGWMPNYYVPTNYFIDWSENSIKRMNTLTIAERNRIKNLVERNLPHYENTLACVKRNSQFYFKKGITYSRTGVYSPSFRYSSASVYDVKGSYIDIDTDRDNVLTFLNSKFLKFVSKSIIYHVVDLQIDALKELPISFIKIKNFVPAIIKKQKQNPQYDYASHEQLEIDALVYQAYGLNWGDIREVENWYERRYGKLVAAQKRNLEALGKPTDYLEIYKGILGEKM
jgi:hypothetical protein